ncbi:MAG: hypothetical protein ACKOHG_20520, partial [Planctomycetia bacterium]
MPDLAAHASRLPSVLLLMAGVMGVCCQSVRGDPPDGLVATQAVPRVEKEGEPEAGRDAVEPVQYLEESLTHVDPSQEAELQAMVDAAVTARLAGIPRPRYIPATGLAPPKGLILLRTDPKRGEFPFGMALGGYRQLRWFEFARNGTELSYAPTMPRQIQNINTFNINRFLLSFHGHVLDERLVYNFALFGTTNVGIRSGVVPIGILGWKFSDAATVGGGMSPVPGTREWIESSPWTVGIDRSMANTFFRPGFSPGV